MPWRRSEKGYLYANPVMGIFVESLLPYFNTIIVFGFECRMKNEIINYQLQNSDKLVFKSLGPEGHFWDYFSRLNRIKKILYCNRDIVDILLLRVPTHRAHSVWKFSGKPTKTALLIIGNQYFTSAYSSYGSWKHFFCHIRSKLHDRGLRKICTNPGTLVMANSPELVAIWGRELRADTELVHTSSISNDDIIDKRSKEGFTNTNCNLLFVGRICNDKGIRELLEAVRLLNNNPQAKYLLDIVGPVGDLGGHTLNDLISKNRISNFVRFHGVLPFGPELFNFYRNSEVYILPSYHEGMPHAILEAMSQGTPVIASAIDGIKDIFTHEEDIIFIAPRNAESIKNAVLNLQSNPALVKRLLEKGLEKVRKFTREKQTELIVDLMRKKWQGSLIK